VSDSLGRLILRAQGRLPTVEPLLPSRYAAAQASGVAWAEQTVEVDPLAPAQPAVASRTAPRPSPSSENRLSPPDRIGLPAAASMGGRIKGQTPSMRAATGALEPPAQARISGEPSSPPLAVPPGAFPDDPLFAPAVVVSAELRPTAADRPGMSEPERLAPTEIVSGAPTLQPAPPLTPELIPRRTFALSAAERLEPRGTPDLPSRPARPSPLAPGTGEGLAPPEVKISIGRLEVHAAAAPRPLPARQSAVRRPTVSLADYLAKRGGKAP
jgi:hypothetical protein